MVFAAGLALGPYGGERIATYYVPLADAAMEVKLEIATTHLWTEEHLSGDAQITKIMIETSLNPVDHLIAATLRRGGYEEGLIPVATDQQIRILLNLKTAVGRPSGCVPRGVWHGMTRRSKT